MKKYIMFVLLFTVSFLSAFVPIYDIQYTTESGENSYYPSLLEGNILETGGIVTGVDFSGGRYYISSPEGGAWNGLYIYDNDHNPEIGDELLLTGEVYEYHGFTELTNISSYQVVSSGNELPNPTTINCSEVNSEAFESVFVEIEDVEVSASFNEWDQWEVSDESGNCIIGIGFYNLDDFGFNLPIGYEISAMQGIISFSWGDYLLHPRNINDITTAEDSYLLSFDSQNSYNEASLNLPINLGILNEASDVSSVSFSLDYDNNILEYSSFDTENSILNEDDITIQDNFNNLNFSFTGSATLEFIQSLVNLNFNILDSGNPDLELSNAMVNENEIENLFSGEININTSSIEIGDTLTVIQRPILNIPEIITPNEEFEIWCIAPTNTINWQAELIYKNNNFALEISSSEYDELYERWVLTASGNPSYNELYDLHVFADNNIDDITENAVRVISEEKENFSFVHISDTHLPTHIFWSDDPEQALIDTSEVEDLRQVINDINLINPEFVLLTGDVVNEGELEDFGNGRCYTKAQEILSEFTVPVYVVAGNHDLGGWDSTPPSQGTSRRDWWRFFGWKWLADVPEGSSQRTQDYSFEYANNKFIGLEAYVNYDDYMYEIFGSDSFIPTQMQWLDSELATSTDFTNRILFYHYDFSENISLESMNVDMALYGHIHSSQGSLTSTPYNLSVDNVCDETQAYRFINIENGEIIPRETSYANWPNDNLTIEFSEENIDSELIITANITNNHDINFTDCAVRYNYLGTNNNLNCSEGTIEHILNNGNTSEFLLKFDINANSSKTITISTSVEIDEVNQIDYKFNSYPNPFYLNSSGRSSFHTFSFSNKKNYENAKIEIFNIKGQKVNTLRFNNSKINNQIEWNGKNSNGKQLSSGIYFSNLIIDNKKIESKKLLLLK